jgi:hypothetical protein
MDRCRQVTIASKFQDGRYRLKRSRQATVQPLEAYYMIKKALLAFATVGAMTTAHAGVVLTEGFENIDTLATSGWVLTNASSPVGSLSWFQGNNTEIFPAQSGGELSYIAANYNSTTDGGAVNDWLITPTFSALYGATVTFWLRGAVDPGYVDQFAYGFSDGTTALTSFVLSSVMTAPTDAWTQITATLAAGSANARFAINYTGALASNIGIDSLVINVNDAAGDVPEPASLAILAAGLIGMGAARRRKNQQA